ncbi:MAG: flagellar hook-basal body complex protein [Gammaproteobacteria bacterium]
MLRVPFLLPILAVLGLTGCGGDEITVSACVSPDVLLPDVELSIAGAGFFMTSNGSELRYSPTGDFCVDQAGFLINGLGQAVQIVGLEAGGSVNLGQLNGVQLPLVGESGGVLTDVSVGATGVIEAVYTAGSNVVVGRLALATFPSSQNLAAEGDAVCRETLASGVARRGVAGQAGFGTVAQGTLAPFACEHGRFDAQVAGEGYFVLNNAGVSHYDASMIFGTDSLSNYVDDHGYRVSGYAVDANGTIIPAIVDLTAPADPMAPVATSSIALVVNLDSDAVPPPVTPLDPNDPLSYNFAADVAIFDSFGIGHVASFYFQKRAPADTWDLSMTLDGALVPVGGSPVQVLTFSAGVLTSAASISSGPYPLGNGAEDLVMTLQLAGVTQTSAAFSAGPSIQDGYTEGSVTATHITTAGEIRLDYSNGRSGVLQGQLVLARFPVSGALALSADGETYLATAGAGAPVVDVPGTAGLGEVMATAR